MNENKCDITVVLDRSGSMQDIAKDMMGGFDKLIEEQKKLPGEALLTLVQFDTDYEFVYRGTSIKDVKPLQLVPRGMTALLDAVGRAIVETGDRLRNMPEHERPGKVVFIVITDGAENSSKEFTKAWVCEKIKHQQEVYNWKFVFLGANQDAFAEAGGLGISLGGVANYNCTPISVKCAYAATSHNLSSLRSGTAQTMDYSDVQKQTIGSAS